MSQEKVHDYSTIFLNDSLYTEYALDEFNTTDLLNILFYDANNSSYNKMNVLDSFCPICKKETSFISRDTDRQLLMDLLLSTVTPKPQNLLRQLEQIGTFQRSYLCPRAPTDVSHDQIYLFRVMNGKLIKIGQYPTIVDHLKNEIKKYIKLNQEIYQELHRAIGLASHGIGVGSYVYLRRIIEKYIVNPKLDELLRNGTIEEKELSNLDFKKKIMLIKDYLPDFLVQNSKVYALLSKGLHELDEKECITYFPIVQNSIEIILDEQIEQIEKEKRKKKISTQLDEIK